MRFVIYKLWRTFPTRFVQAAGSDLVALSDILGHSTANSAIHYVQRTTQDYREAMKRYRLSTPLGGSKRITAAQKVYVGRTRNRTRAVSSLLAVQQKVCKTFTRRFDSDPRLQASYTEAEAFTRMQPLLGRGLQEPFASKWL